MGRFRHPGSSAGATATIAIELTCPVATPPPCRGKLTLRYRHTTVDALGHKHTKTLTAGSTSFQLTPGKATHVKVKLKSAALAVLALRKSLKTKAHAKATDGAGTTRKTSAAVKLKLANGSE